ncbi:tRNA (N(6)-L-threonylcarbamoyladenosine(37)-C(2))-methylthiotransferase MtaB [Algimonas arctica]|uniref:tRNA (N(6)-L-threonylcarbamoyladenosine(37)-C(2))-methylthiotransferase MtaB n=1 Tax=Algimonas arctica TaxID=1479486 RepID=A0A8J3CQM8_9PROT|nr:tRNA (N(6)-L-threonylcarbamoyladenosine(37)-C(2))-methylthiotransferase MtaB [Algimonas arctica]GHA87830.1 tRNA (N(6)-L-threonylcarbamoyladenosine(37)-C(2))-methylthiotransferase MtaB [Algimonas arctica]
MTQDVDVITLGCRLNASESDAMVALARDDGLTNAVIINTCAVTNDAVAESRRRVRKARRDRPDATIIVTGCAAQIDPTAFAAMDEVDQVLGNHDKMLPGAFLDQSERIRVNDIMTVRENAPQFMGSENSPDKAQSRTRAFLQVQNGCDHRCTFCIIPYGRGNARSVPAGEVVSHVRNLVRQGYREVVLTGVDLSSWGGDLPGTPPLGDLVRRVLKLVPELDRLRLSSIDPAEVDPILFEQIVTEPRMTPYLHLSLQSGDDMILKRMKRRHSRQQVIDLCHALQTRRPEITFGADIIAGFPTEDDAMFDNSLRIVSDVGIPWLHVFPYSARAGTPAAKIPPVDGNIVKARAKTLREAGTVAKAAHLRSRVGDVDVALFEETGQGRLPDFSLIRVNNPPPAGSLGKVTVIEARDDHLIGSLHG